MDNGEVRARDIVFDGDACAAVVRDEFEIGSSDGVTSVLGNLWTPPRGQAPRAVVQLVHGMAEHIVRYDAFARELASIGCVVAGHDHVGHGRSVRDRANPSSSWGVLEPGAGADHLVEDVERVRRWLDAEYAGLPHAMFGHSMGSFVLRVFLGRYGRGLRGAVVCGTGWQPRPALAFGRVVTRALGLMRGWDHRSRLVDGLAAGAYARAFASEEQDDLAWLTRDPVARAAYRDDPACGFMFSVSAYHELFRLVGMAQDRSLAARVPHDLPVLLLSGDRDPVGGRGTAVPKVAALMRTCGLRDVEERLYPGARHELVNETNRGEVVSDIVRWLMNKGVLEDGADARMS